MTTLIQGTVFAKSLDPMLAFYEALGFQRVSIKPGDFGVLHSREAELTIVQIPAHISEQITILDPPAVRSDTAVKLVFVVPSLDQALTDVEQNGGSKADFERWQYGNFCAQECVDPEGNVLQLREIVSKQTNES